MVARLQGCLGLSPQLPEVVQVVEVLREKLEVFLQGRLLANFLAG